MATKVPHTDFSRSTVRPGTPVMASVPFVLTLACSMASVTPVDAAVEPVDHKKPEAKPRCAVWVQESLRTAEQVPVPARYDRLLDGLSEACGVVPKILREAARPSRAVGQSSHQANEARAVRVARAALTTLPGTCRLEDLSMPASGISSTCPLDRKGLELAPELLAVIRAGDYMILRVLETSLRAAGEYDDGADRLLRTFALSAGVRGERMGAASRRREPSSKTRP